MKLHPALLGQLLNRLFVAGERKHGILSSWPLLKGYGIAITVLNTKRATIWLEPWKQMVFQKRGTDGSYSLE